MKPLVLRRPLRRAFASAILATLSACGPAGLIAGTSELTRTEREERVLLVFLNESGQLLTLDLTGTNFDLRGVPVAPAAETRLEVPAGLALRVRGREARSEGVPATWDWSLAARGRQATCRLGRESLVFGSRLGQTSSQLPQDVFELTHYDSVAKRFETVGRLELGFAPDVVVLAPGGGRVYTLTKQSGSALLHAFVLDAETGTPALIPAPAAGPQNPQVVAFREDVDLALDPRGRFLWVLDHEDATRTTRVLSHVLDTDGLPVPTASVLRGRLGDFVFQANGRDAFVAEDFGQGYEIRALRVRESDGGIDFQSGAAPTPCASNDPNPPRIHLHPNGRFAYVTTVATTPTAVRLGSYLLLGDGSILRNAQCLGFELLLDLDFDPLGDVLYVTGVDASSQEGVLRYSIDPVSGELGLVGTQTMAESLSRIASQSDPELSESDPQKNLVLVVRDDELVPHTRGAGATLTRVPDATPLPYGSTSSARTMQTAVRGKVQVQIDG